MQNSLAQTASSGLRTSLEDGTDAAQPTPMPWLILFGLVLMLAIAVGTALTVEKSRENTIADAKKRLESAVLLSARHFDQQLGDFAALQDNVIAEMESHGIASPEIFGSVMGTLAVHEILRAEKGGWTDVAGVNLFDFRGTLINSSQWWPVPDISISDRTYFNRLRDNGAPLLAVQAVSGRLSASPVIVFGRRISGPHGEFLGVVTRAIARKQLETFFASAGLDPGTSMSILYRDGALLARYPDGESLTGKDLKDRPREQQATFGISHFTVRQNNPADGRDQLVFSRMIAMAPFIIVATAKVDSTLAAWRSQTRFFVAVAGLSLISIALALYLIVRQMRRQHLASQGQLMHLAHFDALTDLPNRIFLREHIEHRLSRLAPGERFAILYIDVDEFKAINDSLGHRIGDELLRSIAQRLQECVGPDDLVARLGDDEFAIVKADAGGQADVTAFIKTIYPAIRRPANCFGHLVSADASIGAAIAPDDGANLDDLLKNTDLAMYSAKAAGRRTFRFFMPEMDAQVKARRAIELDLRQAVVDGGFEIYYQPLVDLASDAVTGCEALLRWQHPERGLISPAEFIPVAEETGLINELGEWVLRTACADAVGWPDSVKLAVNVSPVQFRSKTLGLKVAAALAESGLPSSRLELEITEAVLIRDDEEALAILHQFREMNVRISLDDFGTGYSSLSYLQRFPFDKIKIDRSFVNDITEAGGSSAIVKAVVNIALARGMTTTAEGVETETQRQILRKLGCTQMQGYIFSPPVPAKQLEKLLVGEASNRSAAA